MKIKYDENGNISHVSYEDGIVNENSLELHQLEVKETLYQAIRRGWKGQCSIAGYSYYLYHYVYTPFIEKMIRELMATKLISEDVGEACIASLGKQWRSPEQQDQRQLTLSPEGQEEMGYIFKDGCVPVKQLTPIFAELEEHPGENVPVFLIDWTRLSEEQQILLLIYLCDKFPDTELAEFMYRMETNEYLPIQQKWLIESE